MEHCLEGGFVYDLIFVRDGLWGVYGYYFFRLRGSDLIIIIIVLVWDFHIYLLIDAHVTLPSISYVFNRGRIPSIPLSPLMPSERGMDHSMRCSQSVMQYVCF